MYLAAIAGNEKRPPGNPTGDARCKMSPIPRGRATGAPDQPNLAGAPGEGGAGGAPKRTARADAILRGSAGHTANQGLRDLTMGRVVAMIPALVHPEVGECLRSTPGRQRQKSWT
jgi:hypothetical protein